MSHYVSHLPWHSQTRYVQYPEPECAPPQRRVRTSKISPAVAAHARQRQRWMEELDRMNATPQFFSHEGPTMWRDEVDDACTMTRREEERACKEDVERALHYQQLARERKERERHASIDRHHHRAHGSVSSVPPRSAVAWPAPPNGSTQFRVPFKSRMSVHCVTPQYRPEPQAPYVFPTRYPQPIIPLPVPERRRPVDRSRMVVSPPIPLVPMAKPPKFSMLARVNPFKRLRTMSMSTTFPNDSVPITTPIERPARLRRNSATRRV
ncbi:hypothetical protein BS17DRAFT_598396 [Gyrodon lividus]|nr:hypothetical protein BS17DRAFT_598396 [Gyrodon lividus]